MTDLGVGKQQLVEIAKALSKRVKLLILDEPTASLNESDSDALLDLLLQFKAQGITSILISHKLNEISKVADSITVLRDGATVETLDCRGARRSARTASSRAWSAARWPTATRSASTGSASTLFEVENWSADHPIHRPAGGEGRQPHGPARRDRRHRRADGRRPHGIRHEPVRAHLRPQHQRHGPAERQAEIDVGTVGRAVENGIAYVTEDRKTYGLDPRGRHRQERHARAISTGCRAIS